MQAIMVQPPESAPAGAGDPAVVAAVSLGWELADLYAIRTATGPAPHPSDRLPGAGELAPGPRLQVGVARIRTLVEQSLPGCDPAAALGSLAAVQAKADQDPSDCGGGIYDLHIELLTALRAGGDALGEAYDLGRELADICRRPADLGELITRLETGGLLSIQGRLADLSSRLPAHAAAAVGATLEQWRIWSIDARAREDMDEVRGALARQRALWRALLTGDKRAREMLDPDTVVAASVRHASRLGTLLRGLAGAYLPAVALMTAATALLGYAIIAQSGVATVIAALGAMAAALVIVRKAMSLTVADTIEELRPGLWGAEIDAAVAQSVLRLPPSLPAARRFRAAPAPSVPSPAPPASGERPSIPAGLAQRVERALHVTRSARRQGLRVPASGPASAEPGPEPAPAGSSKNGNHAG